MIIKSYEINKINTTKSKLFIIYGENEGLKKEIISRTIHNRKDLISEWIVEAIKKDV